MKVVWVASIGFVALVVLAPSANAQQATTTVSLAQKLQPVIRSYPRVAAGTLDIRTGMTVSQAEAIAAKSYPAKPQEYTAPDTYRYKEVIAQSHPFAQHVDFSNQTARMSDDLSLYFLSPVSGNTLSLISRKIVFYKNAEQDPNSALKDPLVSTLKASLINKYGPPSHESDSTDKIDIAWSFTQNSLVTCKTNSDCVGDVGGMKENDLTQLDPAREGTDPATNPNWNVWQSLENQCGVSVYAPSDVFTIVAPILINRYDTTKATEMTVNVGDVVPGINGGKEAVKQLKAAAINFYKTVSKAPAAPKI